MIPKKKFFFLCLAKLLPLYWLFYLLCSFILSFTVCVSFFFFSFLILSNYLHESICMYILVYPHMSQPHVFYLCCIVLYSYVSYAYPYKIQLNILHIISHFFFPINKKAIVIKTIRLLSYSYSITWSGFLPSYSVTTNNKYKIIDMHVDRYAVKIEVAVILWLVGWLTKT